MVRLLGLGTTLIGLCIATSASPSTMEMVLPSAADPQVQSYNDPSLVISDEKLQRDPPLVIYLPGTNGRSETAPFRLLQTIAGQGYRVVFLSYNDVPAVNQVCPLQPNPGCAAAFREIRAFGDGQAPVSNLPAEAIIPRLTALLRYLAREHPGAGWENYLGKDGNPEWSRIIVSGLSQGAGMAAFIAKRYAVQRVVLFSSPWDDYGPKEELAPWLLVPSATPPDRWWAERHSQELTSALLARAYQALRIPPDHIFVLNGRLPKGSFAESENPYHGSTVRLPQYEPYWKALYGTPSDGKR